MAFEFWMGQPLYSVVWGDLLGEIYRHKTQMNLQIMSKYRLNLRRSKKLGNTMVCK